MSCKLSLKMIFLTAIISLLVVFIASCEPGPNASCEKKCVAFIELPRAVRKTLQQQLIALAKVEAKKIAVSEEDGQKIYEIELTANNIDYEFEIAEDGKLVKKEIEWTFDKNKIGAVPKGWVVSETNTKGRPATWQVVGDESTKNRPNIVAITDNENKGHTYNLLIAENTNFRNVGIEVSVKAISGRQDQGGGVIWRAEDKNNYYIARWNPLEGNFRVYFVKDGKRTQLASADTKLDVQKWHKLKIEHVGRKIKAKLNGKKLIEIEDITFRRSGKVGLWTKADAATAFDKFEIEVEDEYK